MSKSKLDAYCSIFRAPYINRSNISNDPKRLLVDCTILRMLRFVLMRAFSDLMPRHMHWSKTPKRPSTAPIKIFLAGRRGSSFKAFLELLAQRLQLTVQESGSIARKSIRLMCLTLNTRMRLHCYTGGLFFGPLLNAYLDARTGQSLLPMPMPI
jgi:hypothetical protein